MHNLTKIRIFRVLLCITWLPSLLFVYPVALCRRKLRLRHVFFFDRYSLGGAQRVHLDILKSIAALPKLVLFTRHSPNEVMKAAFDAAEGTACKDIHFWCDNLLLRLFSVHYWAFYLNRHRNLIILSSNSTFFYDLLPWLRKDFQRIELLHNFTYGKKGMEFFGLANYRNLDKRITVDAFTALNIREQYRQNNIPEVYLQRLKTIEPGVEIPSEIKPKPESPLAVLYAGRGGPQKRVWIIDRIARHCYEQGWPVIFHFAGDMEEDLSDFVKGRSVVHGQVSDSGKMKKLYESSHVIILTSAYEGFPMVIKEGMANGCIPIVTALPGNLTHLRHGENALLLRNAEDEEDVVAQGIDMTKLLCHDDSLRKNLENSARSYALSHFGKDRFTATYRDLLNY